MAKHLINKNELGTFKYGMSTEVVVAENDVMISWKGQSKQFNKKDLTNKFFMDCWGGFPEVTPFQYPANPLKILNNIFSQKVVVTSPEYQNTHDVEENDPYLLVLPTYGTQVICEIKESENISYAYINLGNGMEDVEVSFGDTCTIKEFKEVILEWTSDKDACSRLPDSSESIIKYIKGFAANKNNSYCKL